MAVFIAFLRAVNVVGRCKVEMKKLRSACEAAGLERAATYIQSGNIVFESAKSPAAVKAVIEGLLRDELGVTSVCIVRTAAQLAATIRANPFPDAAALRPSHLLTIFLAGKPAAGAAGRLAAYRGPERAHLRGDTLYVDYAAGVARSKLSPAFLDRALGTQGTARNWNTVNRLLEMARALGR